MHGPDKYKAFRQRYPDLAHYLREWCSGQSSRRCLPYLVAAATALAMKYVSGAVWAAAQVEEIAPHLSAQASVVDLFKKPGPGSPLCKALNLCQRGDQELVLAFIPYAVRTIRNALRHNLKFTDPLGYRMFEKIDESCGDIRLYGWPENDPQWLTCRGVVELNHQSRPWTPGEVNEILSAFAGEYCMKEIEWIFQTVRVVSSTDGYQRFVGIRLLHRELCHVLNRWCQDSDVQTAVRSVDPLLRQKISRFIAQVRDEGHEHLQSYRQAERIGQDGMAALHRALDAYLDDFHEDGHRPLSRFAYVAAQWLGLTQQHYIVQLRSPFQGAIDYMEQRLRDLLSEK